MFIWNLQKLVLVLLSLRILINMDTGPSELKSIFFKKQKRKLKTASFFKKYWSHFALTSIHVNTSSTFCGAERASGVTTVCRNTSPILTWSMLIKKKEKNLIFLWLKTKFSSKNEAFLQIC